MSKIPNTQDMSDSINQDLSLFCEKMNGFSRQSKRHMIRYEHSPSLLIGNNIEESYNDMFKAMWDVKIKKEEEIGIKLLCLRSKFEFVRRSDSLNMIWVFLVECVELDCASLKLEKTL